ncbi:MAG: hypothetical protein NC204_03770 [Candidatus Amulumruptor caecigallinarius]|nr:hypothetical protein [Candidatus Amulumruptor caecigallinarius]
MNHTTSRYSMTASRFFLEMVFKFGAWWMAALFFVAFVGLVCGITMDMRWLILSLMIIFIIIPMGAAFAYYFYGLRRECALNVIPHQLILTDDAIVCRVYPRRFGDMEDDRGEATEEKGESEKRHSEKDDEFMDYIYPYSSFRSYNVGGNAVTIPFAPPMKGFLWIPASAFDDNSKAKDFFETLYIRIK